MKRLLILQILVGLLLSISSCSSLNEEDTRNIYVFTHVNAIPMDKEYVLADYTVIVKDGKVLELGPSSKIKIPGQANIINAEGKYLLPALSDMHIHLEGDALNVMYPPDDKYSKEEVAIENTLFLYLANGITLVDVMSAFPEHIALREKINKDEMLGPRLILSRMIDAAGKAWPPPISSWVNNADEAKKAVNEAHEMGYDRIKVYSFLDKASYDSIIATAKELNMPVDGHIPFSVSVEYAITSGQNMIAHSEELMKFAEGFDKEQIDLFASLLADNDTWLTPTLITSHNIIKLLDNHEKEFNKPGTQYINPMTRGIWSYLYENIYKAIPESDQQWIQDGYLSFQIPLTLEYHKKGGRLLSGTDALIPVNLHGFTLHDELKELVSAGLSPFEALKTSTTNPYEFLGELDSAGTIEPGKLANLVLLDGNPLEDISSTKKIAGVFTQNQWISKEDIDRRLNEIAESNVRLSNLKSD